MSNPYLSFRQLTEPSVNNGSLTLGLMPSLHQVAALVQRGEMDCQVAVDVSTGLYLGPLLKIFTVNLS